MHTHTRGLIKDGPQHQYRHSSKAYLGLLVVIFIFPFGICTFNSHVDTGQQLASLTATIWRRTNPQSCLGSGYCEAVLGGAIRMVLLFTDRCCVFTHSYDQVVVLCMHVMELQYFGRSITEAKTDQGSEPDRQECLARVEWSRHCQK